MFFCVHCNKNFKNNEKKRLFLCYYIKNYYF